MKKKTLALALALASASLLTSCTMRSCYCCEMVGQDVMSSTTYVDMSQACESLNTKTYKCMDEGSHLPCTSVAFDMKR